MDVKKFLPYILTLMVGFFIAWILQQQRGPKCDCDKMQDRIDYLEDKLLRVDASEPLDKINQRLDVLIQSAVTLSKAVGTLQDFELNRQRANKPTPKWKIDGDDVWHEGSSEDLTKEQWDAAFNEFERRWENKQPKPTTCLVFHSDGKCDCGHLTTIKP